MKIHRRLPVSHTIPFQHFFSTLTLTAPHSHRVSLESSSLLRSPQVTTAALAYSLRNCSTPAPIFALHGGASLPSRCHPATVSFHQLAFSKTTTEIFFFPVYLAQVSSLNWLLEDDGRYGLYFSELDSGKKRVGPPKDDDWGNAKVFVQFLHVFYDITLKFSVSLSVTSNMFFHKLRSIATELSTLANSGDFLLCEMTVAMKSKFDKYWGKIEDVNKLLIIALVLDPRYKLDYVKFCFGDLFDENKVNEMTYDIKELLIKLYEFYNGVDNISSSDPVSRSIPLENEGDMGKVNENVDFRLERLKKFKKMKEKKDFVDLKNEVESFSIYVEIGMTTSSDDMVVG
ncbi:hypothetical protein Ddye_016321 [Dipteronia dyeriana]|uniref:hAT-like transposase RNase-H fold domain-containing protein n=1 Tax=Dipteronia dyeriana TaxID=168575 RepID=A0AAD9U6N9_9ROSI|nr:hypothetical protein Ddye_016321 [Dipteronia dyeriana]